MVAQFGVQFTTGLSPAILIRLEWGTDPLQDSIEKWKTIVEWLNRGEKMRDGSWIWVNDMGSETCGMCRRYYKPKAKNLRDACTECPIMQDTRYPACKFTPYDDFLLTPISRAKKNPQLVYAKRELKYLIDLQERIGELSYG